MPILMAAFLLLPLTVFSLPTAAAGTACEATIEDSAPSICTFLCFAGDSISAYVTAGVIPLALYSQHFTRQAYVVAEAKCGGFTLICNMSSWGPSVICQGDGVQSDGVGTCWVQVQGGYDSGFAGAQAACYSLSTRATVASCVSHATVEPGSGDAVAQYVGSDPCTDAYWLLTTPGAEVVRSEYDASFPDCVAGSCRLGVEAYRPVQVDPTAASLPYGQWFPSTKCDADGTCYVATLGTGELTGWNGAAIIRCDPGTEAATPLNGPPTPPVQCARAGANLGPVSTGMIQPKVETVNVPFGTCVSYQFTQSVTVVLMRNPAGDTYTMPDQSATSAPAPVCNGVQPAQAVAVSFSIVHP
jgi:hypothetical protein